MSLNPAYSFLKTHVNLLKGRLHFPKGRVGHALTMEDGRKFVIFREVVVDPGNNQPENPEAVFRVRFHVANMSPEKNKLFSLIPIPLFVGLPGFRSKLWMIDEKTGDFQGIYEWDSGQDAQNYANSIAMRFMTGRSVPGSVSYKIFTKDEWDKLGIK
ncbi:MAG: YdhR family protein [Bacillota bacterium]